MGQKTSNPSYWGEFGQRMWAARNIAGLTQAELARHVGLSRASISNIEKGHQGVTVPALPVLARALDTTTEWLVTGRGPAHPSKGTR